MRVVVLGGSGFLGSWTVRALAASGHGVTAIVRSIPGAWRLSDLPRVEVLEGAGDRWAAEIVRLAPEVIVVLDWAGVESGLRDDAVQWENLARTRRVVDAAIRGGTRRVVAVGSQAEYGPRPGRTDENVTPAPVTAYGRAKLAALDLVRDTCDRAGVEWVWARVFSVFGPMDNPGLLLPSIAEGARTGHQVRLSSGVQPWSYLYAADAGLALALLASHPDALGIVNVAHPDAPRLRDTVELFAGFLTPGATLAFGAAQSVERPSAGLEADVRRLAAIGWTPRTARADGLRATADWLQNRRVLDPFIPARSLPFPPAASSMLPR